MQTKESLLIKNVTIVPMTKDQEMIEHGYILIKDGLIQEVGSERPAALTADQVIDGTNRVAIPGLINGHTHTPMSLLRGYRDDLPLMDWLQEMWVIEGKMTADDVYWASMLSMIEMIESGTTTFSDMYFGLDEIAQAVDQAGLRALLCEAIMETAGNGEERLQATIAFVEKWKQVGHSRITPLLSPHAPYTCSPNMIEKIVQEAERLDCAIHTHLAETRQEMTIIANEYQESPITLMEKTGLFSRPVIAAHGVYLSDQDIAILQQHQAGLIYNPKSNMKLASGIAPIAHLLEQGVRVGIGTDGSASNNALDMIEEMRFASLLQKVANEDATALSAYQTLALGTSQGARALGIDQITGTIETGKQADITLIDFDQPHLSPKNNIISHIIYSVKSTDITHTIVDGQVLLNNRQLMTIDKEKVIWHINEIKERLLS
ncbi:amidohydrolase [Gracilibacillus alcaliphilus]|uniref:amidohydrolase n=1 Tax=Gracilibacillus alcaliphilus TaxID=1401441 RepID=UPI0019568BBC|nr:amidohydrolase [Gracilibacillus alcaliphilus]MBM7677226.1 5-methylthioadenosine/S-adenosylhomocysteine deaminase [Gracilibacillus alcaliphilus]